MLVSFLLLWWIKFILSYLLEAAVRGGLALLLWACDEAAHLGKREAGEEGLGSHHLLQEKVLNHLQDLQPSLALTNLPQARSWA